MTKVYNVFNLSIQKCAFSAFVGLSMHAIIMIRRLNDTGYKSADP